MSFSFLLAAIFEWKPISYSPKHFMGLDSGEAREPFPPIRSSLTPIPHFRCYIYLYITSSPSSYYVQPQLDSIFKDLKPSLHKTFKTTGLISLLRHVHPEVTLTTKGTKRKFFLSCDWGVSTAPSIKEEGNSPLAIWIRASRRMGLDHKDWGSSLYDFKGLAGHRKIKSARPPPGQIGRNRRISE